MDVAWKCVCGRNVLTCEVKGTRSQRNAFDMHEKPEELPPRLQQLPVSRHRKKSMEMKSLKASLQVALISFNSSKGEENTSEQRAMAVPHFKRFYMPPLLLP